jgi:hypothetical protein
MSGAGGSGGAGAKPVVDMKMAMGATVLTILAVVFLAVGLFTPWYMTSFATPGTTASANIGFSGISSTTNGNTTTQSWDDFTTEYKNDNNGTAPQLPGVYSTSMYLSAVAMVLAILGIPVGYLTGAGKVKPMVAMLVAILAIVLALAAFGTFAAGHVAAYNHDFGASGMSDGPHKTLMGTNSMTVGGNTLTVTWGPGIGYWMPLIAAVMVILSLVLGMRSMKGTTPSSGAPPM